MDDISLLVDRLGAGDAAEDERALTLLAMHGRKSVEALLGAAASPDPVRRALAITGLGRIGDARARRTLTVALADRSPVARAAAATALSAFPTVDIVSRLRSLLERETDVEVRLRAVATLVDHFNTGTVEALDPLLHLLRRREEDRRVRLESLKVLVLLPPSEARSIAASLIMDKDTRLAAAAARYTGERAPKDRPGLEEALRDLDSPDYFVFRRSASLLASMGESVIGMLVSALRQRAADPVACARVSSVLRETARGRERAVAHQLDEVVELVPLGLLVDIVGDTRDRTALYHLKGVIDRLESPDAVLMEPDPASKMARGMIVAKAHYYLARSGSRVAFDSLKTILGRRDEKLMGEILMAVEEIGAREELLDLLARYDSEEPWMKDRIQMSFRRLMKKLRLSPDDRIFERLDGAGRSLLATILSSTEARPARVPRRRTRHVDSL